MCGIVGLWHFHATSSERLHLIKKMTKALHHRGPDGHQEIVSEGSVGWALGHARLSIIDLEGGTQPIWNEDRSKIIVCNGEIYNYKEIQEELLLKGHQFATASDSEVALHAFEEWGVDSFRRFNGMFAFILIDIQKNECYVVRDPIGIKPLHYVKTSQGVAFASEIKAILELPSYKREVDFDNVHLFMNFRYTPHAGTLFKGIHRLPQGHYAHLRGERMEISSYYELPSEEALSPRHYDDKVKELEHLLARSVKRHLVADVEVATYLSGGVDSSCVAYWAAKENRSLKSFCMGFNDQYDENNDARLMAHHIGSGHEDLFMTPDSFYQYKEVVWHVEEPKVNCLQGHFLAKKVSKKVKVALSGLGGDELFAGYDNNDYLYPMTHFPLQKMGKATSLSALQSFFPSKRLDHYFRGAEVLSNMHNPLAYYSLLRNSFDHNPFLMKAIYASPRKEWFHSSYEALRPFFNQDNPDVLNELLRLEIKTKLTNDFLLTEDRVSMAHGLEVRVPFLDKELVEFACKLPSAFKYHTKEKKWPLKQVMASWCPPDLLQKKKWGFSFTPHLIFETHLRPLAHNTLTEKRVKELGLFSWPWIESVLASKPHPKLRWHYFNLWVMVGLQHWLEHFFLGQKNDDTHAF